MKNKTFLILISVGFLIALIGLFSIIFANPELGGKLLNIGLPAINLLGLIMLIKNSTIKETIYFNFISLFIIIIMLGAMLKIMHWPGNNIMLIVGLMGIMFVYMFRFIKKQIKAPLDMMKLAWVIITSITSLGIFLHWLPREFKYLPNFIMLVTTIYFASICLKNKDLLES